MQVLLINPPWTYPRKYFHRTDLSVSIPMGLLYVASSIMDRTDAEVKILDAFTLGKPVTVLRDSYHVGAGFGRIRDAMAGLEPDIVGITSPFSSQIDNALLVAGIARKAFPRALVVMGGPHASVRPIELLMRGADICVLGEAEDTFCEIVRRRKEQRSLAKIPGTAYKGRVYPRKGYTDDLDSLPLPAYPLVDMERYFRLFGMGLSNRPYNASPRSVPMITSRGCPFGCTFCSIHLHMGRKWRAHSAAYVLNHLEHLTKVYGVRHVSFEDDNLTLDPRRFEQILDGIIERKIKITWDTPNGVRADMLTGEILKKAKRTGCRALVVGIESGSQDVLDRIICKQLDLAKVVRVVRQAHSIGLTVSAFFVVGMPGETKRDIRKTLSLALRLNRRYGLLPSVTFAAPLYGTRLYEEARARGYLEGAVTPASLLAASHVTGRGLIRTPEFTPQYLKREIGRFYRKLAFQQFLRPSNVIRAAGNPAKFVQLAGMLVRKVRGT